MQGINGHAQAAPNIARFGVQIQLLVDADFSSIFDKNLCPNP